MQFILIPGKHPRSAKCLRAKKPVVLVYSEEFSTLREAMKRERQIKKLTKVEKEAFVKKLNKNLKTTNLLNQWKR